MTVAEIKARIADELNRSDLTTSVAKWLEASHKSFQYIADWHGSESAERLLSVGVEFNFNAPTDIKAPIGLTRIDSTNLTGPIVPYSFYHRASIFDVWKARQDVDSSKLFDIYEGKVEFTPHNTKFDDQFALFYYKILELPADSEDDVFTRNYAEFLVYDVLTKSIPFLGGADRRYEMWRDMRSAYLANAIQLNTQLHLGGAVLQMRG